MRPDDDAETRSQQSSLWRTAVRLVGFAFEEDFRMAALTVAASVGASLAEGLGLVLLLPLLAVAGVNFSGSTAATRFGLEAQQVLMRTGIPHRYWLAVVLAVFLLAGAARSLLRWMQSTMSYSMRTRVQLALSRRLYEALVRAEWVFLVRQRAGRLTYVLTGELNRVLDALAYAFSLINLLFLAVLYLVLALKLSVGMTVLVMALGGTMALLQRRSLGRTRRTGTELSESVAEVYAATTEHLQNLKSVKTYQAEEYEARVFGELCRDVAEKTRANARHQAATAFRSEAGTLAALVAIIFVALTVLHVQAATMLILLLIFTRLVPQLTTMQGQAHEMVTALPSFDNVLRLERECLEHSEHQPRLSAGDADDGLRLREELRLDDVWFSYAEDGGADRGREFVLRGTDLAIETGKLTALVGPSGAGKSTIADLVNGLLTPTGGSLVLDGRALDGDAMRSWRRQVGYVGQDTVLFHQSVRRNLLWARPESTEEELREALRRAAAEFVFELPRGLDTVAGDRGVLLSSGQRQRISLARALLRRPALLVLDEATNALDVENEARVLDAIREAMRTPAADGSRLTVLMIAHRATAIRRADRVYQMEDGRVVQTESHAELDAW